jgi:hypothetical protein
MGLCGHFDFSQELVAGALELGGNVIRDTELFYCTSNAVARRKQHIPYVACSSRL